MLNARTNVRFWGQSGRESNGPLCQLMTQSGHACFAISKQSREKAQLSIGKIGLDSDTEPEPDRVADLGGRALIVGRG